MARWIIGCAAILMLTASAACSQDRPAREMRDLFEYWIEATNACAPRTVEERPMLDIYDNPVVGEDGATRTVPTVETLDIDGCIEETFGPTRVRGVLRYSRHNNTFFTGRVIVFKPGGFTVFCHDVSRSDLDMVGAVSAQMAMANDTIDENGNRVEPPIIPEDERLTRYFMVEGDVRAIDVDPTTPRHDLRLENCSLTPYE